MVMSRVGFSMRDSNQGKRLRWLVASALLLAGCSSGEPEAGGPATFEQASEYCQALVEQETRCGDAPPANHCDTYAQCVQSLFRADVMSELTKCTRELQCADNSDTCGSALSAQSSSPTFGNYKNACRARQTECEPELTSEGFFCFEDELGVATDQAIEEFRACLGKSCDSIRGCMDAISYRYRCKG
jgi:hypothetical protein